MALKLASGAVVRRSVDDADPATAEFAAAMRTALSERPRRIAPKFFYDEAGSRLFDRICELDEYYLTRTELDLLRAQAPSIARLLGDGAQLVEFGAGNLSKIRLLLDALPRPARYIPVDLSVQHLRGAARELALVYPGLRIAPCEADFMRPLASGIPFGECGARVGLFLGSTIGNLSECQALDFLSDCARLFRGGGLLVGVDLVKDPGVIHRAYNDAQGITAQFNLNLLARANRELGCDFEPDGFDHHACYDPAEHCVRMYLISRRRQAVRLGADVFGLDSGDAIHTEDSRKYTVEGFRSLARRAGLVPGTVWCDARQWFSLHWLAAPAGERDGATLIRGRASW
jgi:dimethylhistidine N-methyltransferase